MDNEAIPVKKIKKRKESWCKRYIQTMDKLLTVISLCALVFSLCYQGIFLNIEAPFEIMSKLGEWMFILSMSVLAAAIFHFFTVHYNYIRDREKFSDIVELSIVSLVTKTDSFIMQNLKNRFIGWEIAGYIPTDEEWKSKNKCEITANLCNWIEECLFVINNTKMEFEILSNYKSEFKDIFSIVSKVYSTELIRSESAILNAFNKKEEVPFYMLEPLLYNYLLEMKPLYEIYNDIITKSMNKYTIEF